MGKNTSVWARVINVVITMLTAIATALGTNNIM